MSARTIWRSIALSWFITGYCVHAAIHYAITGHAGWTLTFGVLAVLNGSSAAAREAVR